MSPSVEPFNKAKYKALMDGLEISEVNFLNIDLGDRYDAEYFTKEYLDIEQQLEKVTTQKVGELSIAVASAFYPAATQLYSVGDTAFVRCVDCIDFPIITRDQDELFEKIPHAFGKENKGISFLKKGEIVITKVGSPCYSSIVEDYEEVALSRTVLGLSDIHGIDEYYLMIFLRCKYGFEQLYRQRELTIQYQLTLPRVKSVDVFCPSEKFQRIIRGLCIKYRELSTESTAAYEKAENLLSDSLGISTQHFDKTIAVKSYADSFLKSGRLDAEYYQSKYEKYTQVLNAQDTVVTLCKLYDQNFVPEAEVEYTYIELASVGSAGEIVNAERKWGSELPTRARRKVNAGQIIVSSIEGSLQSCALITSEFDDSLCSTGFYVMDSKDINSETLLVLFKCEIMQSLMKQRCSGSILAGITKDEFLSMPLPSIDENVQKEIAKKVKKSFELRRKSKQLFENTKKAVEMAIEQGEDAALAWLKANVPNLEV